MNPYPPPSDPLNTGAPVPSPTSSTPGPYTLTARCVKCGLAEPDTGPSPSPSSAPRAYAQFFHRRLCTGTLLSPNYATGTVDTSPCADGVEHLHLACPCGHEWTTRTWEQAEVRP